MRNCILALSIAFFSIVEVARAGDQTPATQPAATQPAGFELTHDADASIGLSFDRPAKWHIDRNEIINTRARVRELVFRMDGFDAKVQSTLKFAAEDAGGPAKINVTAPDNPSATASKIFSIDGQPARLTAYKIPDTGVAELLIVQTAKGTHSYTIMMSFPSSQRDKYLALADAICASVRFINP